MAVAKILGGYTGTDIELCRTTNERVQNMTRELLIEERIPFTANCKKIPFFRRDKYKGASRVWVISTNPNCYSRARQALDTLDLPFRSRLKLSNF